MKKVQSEIPTSASAAMMVQHQTQWDIWLSSQSVKDYYVDLMIENMWVLTFFTPVSLESGFTIGTLCYLWSPSIVLGHTMSHGIELSTKKRHT